MKGFCPLASGSKGNCIFFGTQQSKVLIDAGISVRTLQARLAEINVDLADIHAILITHEHTDHIAGLKTLACKYGIPVLANHETAKGIVDALHECPKFKIFTTGEIFEFGDMEIHPFSIPHDTIDPVGFSIRVDNLKLGFCADLGRVTPLVQRELSHCDYLYLEANRQVSMVYSSSRPDIYKRRVLGPTGHLSNEACAQLLTQIHSRLKHVHLAHLSSECNSHEVAMRVVQDTLKEKQITIDLSIAFQEKISREIRFN